MRYTLNGEAHTAGRSDDPASAPAAWLEGSSGTGASAAGTNAADSRVLGFAGYGWAPDYGWGYGGYSGLYEESWFPRQYDDSQSQAGGLMLMQAPAQPLPPPEPAHPVMQIYHWAENGENPQATFSIVSRDGVVRHAVAVWVQDSEVRYTAVNGAAGRMAASAIDCGATGRLNSEQQLTLRLPGCMASQ